VYLRGPTSKGRTGEEGEEGKEDGRAGGSEGRAREGRGRTRPPNIWPRTAAGPDHK